MRCICVILFWLAVCPVVTWADPAAEAAFNVAAKAFRDGFYKQAEPELAAFLAKFPQSERIPEAVLLQAQCRFHLKQHGGALQLLNENLAQAGKWADEYRFWIAECHFDQGDLKTAGSEYARWLKEFPDSPRRLEAAYSQAVVAFRLGELAPVVSLLREPEGDFQKAARARPKDEWLTRGALLLAEALLLQNEFRAGEQVLQQLAGQLSPELNWRQLYLLGRIQMADKRLALARESATRLIQLAEQIGQKPLLAESIDLHGQVLELLKEPAAAVASYERNLAPEFPLERRRQALLKIIELTLAQNRNADTIQKLTAYIQQFPKDPALELARLTIGELFLKEFYLARESGRLTEATNSLEQARQHLDQFITTTPETPHLGQALLHRGWCFWEAGRLPESLADFQAAAKRLPFSEDQAVARFKWADAQFRLQDFAGAVTNYQHVIAAYAELPAIKDALFDQALYQTVQAGIRLGELAVAQEALKKILTWYPDSFFSDRSMLLFGQTLNVKGRPAEARALFQDFLKQFPKPPLLPDLQLAIARTYVQERDWTAAVRVYTDWIEAFPDHPASARAEFDRGWLRFKAGDEAGALRAYTNFVARFPTHEMAPIAEFEVANSYFNRGEFVEAERQYQRLYQNTNWPPSELKFQARMMAGRAATARQGFREAREYFANLVNDGPPSIVPEALFALGDIIMEEPVEAPSAPDQAREQALKRFGEAINAFSKIEQFYARVSAGDVSTNALVPLAWGKIANCHLQLASIETNRYDRAAEFYQKVVESPAQVAARSQAKIGLGEVLEKRAKLRPSAEQSALWEAALKHYLDVVYETNLREGERPDPFFIKEAGLAAGRLWEEQRNWKEAINLYTALQPMLPALRPFLEKKIQRIQERQSG